MMKTYLSYMLILALIFSFSSNAVYADFEANKIDKDLPMLLGSSNQGTEFLLTFHPGLEGDGENNMIEIYVVSEVVTTVTLEIPALEYKQQITTTPNKVSKFSLSPAMAQMYSKTEKEAPQAQQVYPGRACIVTADNPIICYGFTNFQNTSEGYLAVPSSGLGKDYIVSSWNDPTADDGNKYLTSYTSIVAVYEKTIVEFTLGGESDNYTSGNNSLERGNTVIDTMSRGDVWLIGVNGEYNDLSGSRVSADRPIAVISGSFCADVPVQNSGCNFMIEQELPMGTWGKKYHVAPIAGRTKASFVRIYAAQPNTTIYRDGAVVGKIKTVGGDVEDGYLSLRAVSEEDELRPAVIYADNPISITQYNTGTLDDGEQSAPFQMVLMPMEQYTKKIAWFAPDLQPATVLGHHYINLYYKSTVNGLIPDDMEYAVLLGGKIKWAPLSKIVENPGESFYDPDVTDGQDWKALTIHASYVDGLCAIRGEQPFAAYGYGFKENIAYGWQLSGVALDISKPDIWRPSVSYIMDCDGYVQGETYDEPRNIDSLRSNLEVVKFIAGSSYNYAFSLDNADFIPGETKHIKWSLNPYNSQADAKATIYFSDRAGNDTTIVIEYKATIVKVLPAMSNWKDMHYGDAPVTKTLTFKNESGKSIPVDSLFLLSQDGDRTWEDNGFTLNNTHGTLPIEIPIDGEFEFNVTFNPESVKDDFLAGKTSFIDSIGVKAEWRDEFQMYCYYRYIAVVKASLNLNIPTLIVPANHATDVSTGPTFEWNSVAEATKYNLEVSNEDTFSTTVIKEEVAGNTYTAMLFSDNERTYYWRVSGVHDNGTSDWSETWSFTTEPANAVNDENNFANRNIKIVPNPANDNITIVADFILTSAKIYDLAGNLVLEANTHNVDISQLPHGTYVIVIETENKTERAKFIKE